MDPCSHRQDCRNDHRPVQTSAVFVPNALQFPADPPPSPPTPAESPPGEPYCEAFEELTLDQTRDASSSPAPKSHQDIEYLREKRLVNAIHVLNTEAVALKYLTRLFETDPIARDGFDRAIEALTRHGGEKGKLVVIGVGKSGLIGKKLVATFNSLGVRAVFLHPTEALHGDLGIVGQYDTLLFITYSGTTKELLSLIPHLDAALPVILLTSHTRPETCEFVRQRPGAILLPAPIHESERASFGVSAPTTSTTAALAVGDALAVTAARELHPSVTHVFARNHPGGAIGSAIQRRSDTIGAIAVTWEDIDFAELPSDAVGADVLRAGYDSRTGWVRVQQGLISPRRIRGLKNVTLGKRIETIDNLIVTRDEMVSISSDTTMRRAVEIVCNAQQTSIDEDGRGRFTQDGDMVLAVVDNGVISGVIEVGELMQRSDMA